MRIKYSDGLWKPAIVSDKHDIRSSTEETPSGESCRRNRRHLLRIMEKGDSDLNPDLDIPNYLNNDDALLEDTTGLEVIKLFSCSTQLSTKFILLKNV